MNRRKMARLVAREIASRGTMAEFSRESGIPYHTVRQLCEGTRVTFDAVERVSAALGLRMSELIRACEGEVPPSLWSTGPKRPGRRGVPVYVDGRRYASITAGARAICVDKSSLLRALERGDGSMRAKWGRWVAISYA